MSKTYTPAEFAAEVDSDPRTVRKFLRAEGISVGKGHRHAIEAKSMRSLKSKFTKWNEGRTPAPEGDAPTEG